MCHDPLAKLTILKCTQGIPKVLVLVCYKSNEGVTILYRVLIITSGRGNKTGGGRRGNKMREEGEEGGGGGTKWGGGEQNGRGGGGTK